MNLLLQLAGGVLGALLLTELFARLHVRSRTSWHVWKPGLRYRLRTDRDVLPELEAEVRLEINREGERGGPPPPASETDTYRVLVAGGSAAECYFLDQRTSWPGVLEELLQDPAALQVLRARRVHVGNIARSLFGSAALKAVFERVLPRYRKLDLLVVMVGATDLLKWIGQGCPQELPDAPPPPDLVFHEHPGQRFGWHPRRWALLELARRARLRWLRPIEVRERAGKMLGEARRMRAAAREMRDAVPDPSIVLDRFERNFRDALGRARAQARRVVVVQQPCFDKPAHTPAEEAHFWGMGIGDPYHQEVTIYYTTGVMARLMALMNERAARVAADLGIETVDLMPVLERSLRTYYDYFHFTPAGSRAVAAAVAGQVLGRPASGAEPPARRRRSDAASPQA